MTTITSYDIKANNNNNNNNNNNLTKALRSSDMYKYL